MLATVMQALDTTIANVPLPHMQGSFSASQDQIAWVLTSYIVAAAIMTPPTGVLAARLGRKRLFLWAVGGFTVSSMLCGAATSLDELVLFRLLQGVFGAGLVPLSQAVLLDTYPRERHGSAMAMWGVGVMVGPILGPTLGGWLTEFCNWRWVFYINVPFGLLALLGIFAFVPETERDRARPFDFFGFALLSLAIGAQQLMLDRGELKDWFSSAEIMTYAALASNISPLNPVLRGPAMPPEWSLDSAHGLAALNAEITRQAATIACLDDFRLMMYIMLIAVPLVVLLRRPQSLPVAQVPAD